MKLKMANVPSYANASEVYGNLRNNSKLELKDISFDSAKEQVTIEVKLSKYILSIENRDVYLTAKTKPLQYLLCITIIGIVVVLVMSASDNKVMKAVTESLRNKQ